MAYGLKYQTQFTSQSDINIPEKNYTLQFLFKDYTGNPISIEGAETTVVQSHSNDDPKAPIKGQSLDISLINKNGSLPITAFQSEDDDGVMVKLLGDSDELLFIGFLVQDDFYETMVDYTHPIKLSANDGLGLLKGVILSDAAVRRAFEVSFRTNGVDTVVYMWTEDVAFYPQAGDIIEILGNTYTIATAVNETTVISVATYNWTITLTTSTGGISQTVDTVYLTGEVNLLKRNSLLSLIAVCLGQTNLSLITNVFLNLYEYRQDETKSTLEQTLLDSQIFISGETYTDCYTALEMIMTAFNCTLFQANGEWNIVHWMEFRRYANNAVPGFIYDETWQSIGTTVFNNNFSVGTGDSQLTRQLFELNSGFIRGYKFSRKKFEYGQPKFIVKNSDLKILGPLLRTIVDGANTHYEYEAPYWQGGEGPVLCERFIRITKGSAGEEVDRCLVVRGPNSNSQTAVGGEPFEVSKGDKVRFSFTFQTNISQPGSLTIIFSVILSDGTINRYIDENPSGNGDWIPGPGFNYTISSGDNSNSKHSVEIASSQAPFDGQITCYLAIATNSPYNSSRETMYRDIRLEYQPYINDTSKIIGQIHKQNQAANKKNNLDVDIRIDDSPRNSIIGTLFLTTKTGNVQNRTSFWRYSNAPSGDRHLGELNTWEEMLWRQKTRSKLEGSFVGNYQDNIISLLTVFQPVFKPNKHYIPGLMTIDYKANQFSCSMFELYDTTDAELVTDYTQDYIYSTT